MLESLPLVAISVKTARSDLLATLRSMDMKPDKADVDRGRRLMRAREAAGYRSAREAAIENNWKYATYGAHERGSRPLKPATAETYAKRFRARGAKVTAREIMYGDEPLRPRLFIREHALERQMDAAAVARRIKADVFSVDRWFGGEAPEKEWIAKLAALFKVSEAALSSPPAASRISDLLAGRTPDEIERIIAAVELLAARR